jgi:hypothetical protein
MVRGNDLKFGLGRVLIVLLTCTTGFSCMESQQTLNIDSVQTSIPMQCDRPNVTRYESVASPLFDTLEMKISITEEDWWEHLDLNWTRGDSVVWTYCFDSLAHYVLRAEFISVPGIKNPCIEIYDATHAGNGFYSLYEVRGRAVECIAKYKAVDFHFENGGFMMDSSNVFKDDVLTANYGRDKITLTGLQYIFRDTVLQDSIPIKIKLNWDQKSRRYE